MPVMNFDLEDGKAPITIRLDANDCERFMAFLDDCQKRRPRSGEQASKQKSRETNKALAKPLSDVFRNFGKEPEIMPLIDAYATARGEVGNEHFSHECLALREQIRTKLLGEQASAVNQGLLDALKKVTVHLIAAHSLLQNGGKKAAASDKIFKIMLSDYEKAFEVGREAIAAAEQEKTE